MAKAVCAFSGGLDSILACRLILDQRIDVLGINFVSPFCTVTKKGCRYEAQKAAGQLGIKLKIVPLGEGYIQMLKQPRHGYGSGMNPCIDCRIFTFRLARDYMEEVGADFLITGEVLGERPMSQHLAALKLIERESGLTGRILRPLSARLLEPTIPEMQGLVDRARLLSIQGRSRKPQIALARQFGIKDYPGPAGGCLLTDKNFARRLKEAFAHNEETMRELKMLRVGRHFRLQSGRKVIVGRDERENKILANLGTKEDCWLEPVDIPGPLTLLIKSRAEADIEIAARLCARYSDGKNLAGVKVKWNGRVLCVAPLDENSVNEMRID
jgi:tRNA U34 2-thiouridine synthase MnmA/TrmU